MSIRKHYLDTHRTGLPVQIKAAADNLAAITEDERVVEVDGHAVTVFGDAKLDHIQQFAADMEAYSDQAGRAGLTGRLAA